MIPRFFKFAVQLWDSCDFFREKFPELAGIFSGHGRDSMRLALARELLRDSDIIIFDESTANLDPEHEQQMLDVTERHFSAKTVLLISHRESSIARFPRRIHLEKLRENS